MPSNVPIMGVTILVVSGVLYKQGCSAMSDSAAFCSIVSGVLYYV